MNPSNKAVVLLSGGLDSAVLAHSLIRAGVDCIALSILYGQKHSRELDSARTLADWFRMEHIVADLSGVKGLFGGSALTCPDIAIPEGHYEDEAMKGTIVPNRNMVFLSLAASLAVSRGIDTIAIGSHEGDAAIYPDCRPEFLRALESALTVGNDCFLHIHAPFLDMRKSAIVCLGYKLGSPFEVMWSCYKGGLQPCGKCGSCVEREEAFREASTELKTRL